jgi:Zn-dependent protease
MNLIDILQILAIFCVFLFSVILHEISHGYIAYKLGDPTAKISGRLTLNPKSHIDPFGSIILPLILYFFSFLGGPKIIFGWARPVPYNPLNFKNFKKDVIKVALAGPLSNLFLAIIFSFIFRLNIFPRGGQEFLQNIIYINVLLGVFNILPIPPLDGSKILVLLFPKGKEHWLFYLEIYGIFLIFILIFFLWPIVKFFVYLIYSILI